MHHRRRRLFAAANARRGHHPHIGAQQVLCAGQLTAQPVADSDHQAGRSVVAPDDSEVVIKRRHLVHLRHRNIHFLGQRDQVPLVQAAVRVVELVQVFNQ